MKRMHYSGMSEMQIKYKMKQCETNADCRLTDWQVKEVNIVVKCFNRFPFLQKV